MSETRARVLVVENDPGSPIGYLADAFVAAGVSTQTVSGDRLPAYDSPLKHEAIVILGGFMGAYDDADHPWLLDQRDLIRRAVDTDVPILGICLGAQLIAHATGGSAFLAERPEVAVVSLQLTAAGVEDPLAEHLRAPVVTYHQDSFTLSDDAVLLAASDRFPQVFRMGSALGIQPHPEVSKERVTEWTKDRSLPDRAGVTTDGLLADIERLVDREDALALFAAWIDEALL